MLKKLDRYILRNFFITFLATFFICLFIVVMQTLWMRVNDLVGKGFDVSLLFEFFLYSALSLVPLALPLAVLLASLMSFGDMGEKLELLAMKSAGISLFRIVLPLLISVIMLSIGAFFFSNNVLPETQKKLWALIFSIKHKSPELEIPTGEFYSGITGLNIYVREKDHKKKLLKSVKMYDFSNGFRDAAILTADSARIESTKDKMNLVLTLYAGEMFENLKTEQKSKNNIPYRRETFKQKEILIDFDGNFNRMDESFLQDQHISKDLKRLNKDIDSSRLMRDSVYFAYLDRVENKTFFKPLGENINKDSVFSIAKNKEETIRCYDADSLFRTLSKAQMEKVLKFAQNKIEVAKSNVRYNQTLIDSAQSYVNKHLVEWYNRFTLSFACVIFFFIGMPLGSIIRKGGLGMPVVISVVFFIIYYILNNIGTKMATEGVWNTFFGMWFISLILLPIGIFLTYKAATDSPLFNSEAWSKMFSKLKLSSKKKI
ncbi:MAG: LptF/LptG family permease [Paludibacteraceae bacterium]|nr:LptF/LptG family permease [Paludibacteraceae bacterium]